MKDVVMTFNRAIGEAQAYVDERRPGIVVMLDRSVKDMLERLGVSMGWGEHHEQAINV